MLVAHEFYVKKTNLVYGSVSLDRQAYNENVVQATGRGFQIYLFRWFVYFYGVKF